MKRNAYEIKTPGNNQIDVYSIRVREHTKSLMFFKNNVFHDQETCI